MTARLCTAPSHDRPPVALGELAVCEHHFGDITDALTGPSAATDTTMDVTWGIRAGVRMVCGDGMTWHNPRDYRPARIARDYAALGLRLTGQTTGEHVAARHSAEAPLPLDAAVAELRVDIHRKLASWVGLHVEKFDLNTAPKPGATVAQLAAFLAVHREQAAKRDWGGAYADELRDLRRQARRLIDLPQPRRVEVGLCPERAEGQPCTGRLWSNVREARDPRPSEVQCDGCGTTWDSTQWIRLGQRVFDRLRRAA